MRALLTETLPLLAGAPNGIKKLRELILELAVRGKLVEQDASDEPASELLKQIAAEKARLVAEGKIKKPKLLTEVVEDEISFSLPSGWTAERLGVLSHLITKGTTPTSIGQSYASSGIGFVKVENIESRRISKTAISQYISLETDELMSRSRLNSGDVLFSIAGTIGKTCSVHESDLPANTNQALAIIRGTSTVFLQDFLLLQLDSFVSEKTKERARGGAMPNVSLGDLSELVLVVPPLAEQRRIVAKVDELMALCDRLEAQQADAESVHAQLVQALLGSLTQASDADEFAANWQRLAEHFHTLFTTEPSIDALKQTLLQLAVMGKLVPQDPSDESADKLLKRISDHRSTYREKKQKSLADISEVEKPFELPCQWAWATLPAIGELARGKSRHRPRNDPSLYAGGNVPLIQTGDVARANGVVKTHSAMYNAKGVEQSRLWSAGTMCITIAANIADSATLGFDACFPDSVVGFIPEFPELNVRYFEFFLRTAKSHLEDFAPSTAQKNINLEILGLLSVPLPPANEVRRIVAKVDQLMALCDQLKTRLTQARQLNEQLASTLVEQAVA